MVRDHQPGEAIFRSILPEDIDRKPFRIPAVGQTGRACWRAHASWTLHGQGQSAVGRETHVKRAEIGANDPKETCAALDCSTAK